mgnify:CR=1 FL=1
MRFAAIIAFLFLISGLFAQDLSAVRLSADFEDVSLHDAIRHMEKKFGLNFSFQSAAIEARSVNCRFEEASWAEIEQCLFGANSLQATPLRDGYISLKSLPAETSRLWTLRFRVLDPDGSALPFAPIQFPSGPGMTDEDGFFSGEFTAAATDIVLLSYLGYDNLTVPVRELVAGPVVNILLATAAIDLSSVLVSEYLSDGISVPEDDSFIRIKPQLAPAVAEEEEPDPIRRFHQVVVRYARTLEAGDLTIRFAGITPIAADKTCTDEAGRDWPCGRAAAGALRMLIRHRAVDCTVVTRAEDEITATCSAGLEDINGWLVEQGWADISSGTEYTEEADAARAEKRGIYLAEWKPKGQGGSGATSSRSTASQDSLFGWAGE